MATLHDLTKHAWFSGALEPKMQLECTTTASASKWYTQITVNQGGPFFFAVGPSAQPRINNVMRVKRDFGQHPYLLIEPASGYSLQVVANHAHEDHVRLRLAAELQHTGHVSAW